MCQDTKLSFSSVRNHALYDKAKLQCMHFNVHDKACGFALLLKRACLCIYSEIILFLCVIGLGFINLSNSDCIRGALRNPDMCETHQMHDLLNPYGVTWDVQSSIELRRESDKHLHVCVTVTIWTVMRKSEAFFSSWRHHQCTEVMCREATRDVSWLIRRIQNPEHHNQPTSCIHLPLSSYI